MTNGSSSPDQPRHVLCIGGAGYVGSMLVGQLLACGHRVRVLDNLLYDNGHSIARHLGLSAFSFINGDMCDSDCLEKALESVTDVILLAALVGDPICKKYPDEAKRVNLNGARNVFDVLDGKGTDRFLFFSTCSNYGLHAGDELASEESELNPQSLYAETKVSMEQHILENAAEVDFSPTILRLATAFGISARMRFDLSVSEFTRELALGHDLLVYDEDTWRPYCHILDISRAAIAVLEKPAEQVKGEVFNVGNDAGNRTKKMIVEAIMERAKSGHVSYKEGGFDPRDYRVCFDKIRDKLGFQTSYSVETGVDNLLSALKNGIFLNVPGKTNFYGNYEIGSK